ncbi:MAG: hypothetical protein ACNA8W_08985, partial [Bradymonadaceae bacterium]
MHSDLPRLKYLLAAVALIVSGTTCTAHTSSQTEKNSSGTPAAAVAQDAPGHFVRLVAGAEHTCALQGDGRVLCWGANQYGQLGPRDDGDEGLAGLVAGVEEVVELAAGVRETCGLTKRGEIFCWGQEFGASPMRLEGGVNIRSLDVGFGVVALGEGGEVYTLKDSDGGRRHELVRKDGLEDVVEVIAGLPHCARTAAGAVLCWSIDDYKLWPGDGDLVAVQGLEQATSLSAGMYHHCAIEHDKTVKCWGLNRYGALGNGASGVEIGGGWRYSTQAIRALGVTEAKKVFTGGMSSCALLESGSVSCWGANAYGQLGLPIETPGTVLQRNCGSGLGAIVSAAHAVTCG